MARARCAARPICCAVDGRRDTGVEVVGAGAPAVAAVAATDWPPDAAVTIIASLIAAFTS